MINIKSKYLAYFSNNDNEIKIIDSISIIFWLILFSWSIIFFAERVLPYDGSGYCFFMIKNNGFFYPHGRWGIIPSQILPVIAIKTSCDLKTILTLYSFNTVFLSFVAYVVIRYYFKQVYTSLAIVFALCLTYRYVFYFSPSDINPGLAPCFLLIASIQGYLNSKKNVFIFFSALFAFWLVNTHMLFMVIMMYYLAYYYIKYKCYTDKKMLIIALSIIAFSFLNINSIENNSYQDQKIPSLSIFIEYLPNIFKLESAQFFINFSCRNYLAFFIFFFSTLIFLFKQRKYLLIVLNAGFLVSFFVLVSITYYKGESPIMQETYYVLLGVFISVSFCDFVLSNYFGLRKLLLILLVLMMNLNAIYACREHVQRRFQFENNLIDYARKSKCNKLIINKANVEGELIWSDWNLGFESLFLSSLQDRTNSITFVSQFDSIKYKSELENSKLLIGPPFNPIFNTEELNSKYFNLAEQRYVLVNSAFAGNDVELKNKLKLSISKSEFAFCIRGVYDGKVFIPVSISNQSNTLIGSSFTGLNGFYMTYKLIRNSGKEFPDFNYCISPILKDVKPFSINSDLLVMRLPNRFGTYTIYAYLYYKSELLSSAEPFKVFVY